MWEYIQLVASQEHWVGEKCREWIQQYDDKKIQQLEQAKQKSCNEMIESPQLEKDAESQAKGNADSSNSCVTKEQAIEAKHSFSSSNRSCKPFKQQQQQQRSISWSEKWLGVKPVIPRGHLDISFLDLLYAVAQCFLCAFQCSTSYRYHQLDQSIKNVVTTALKRQQLEDQIVDVVVGLSVRSLLDLYLLARKYPPHSEVIMVPPINIPDMIHVLEHHQLQVVAVDLPLSTDEEQHSVTVAVDVQAVREAISERTVAIVVVHPFGMISASDVTMKQLYKLAQQHRLDLLEDCAECFSGLEGSNQVYLGSPFATVSFFSFGLIKTCTSLGGALALVRQITKDPDEHSSTTTLSSVATKMSRLQFSLYQQTPPREYAWKVIKSLFICFATCHPVVYGIIISCCQRLGLDFDAIAVRFTRSFVIAADELETAQGQKQFVAKLRKRPSNPLMSLLHRRLRNSGAKSVVTRTIRCHQLMQQLTKLRVDGLILPPKCDSGNNTWWLYPINSCLLSPDKMCQLLRQHGFDATRGMSQLNCIVKTSPSIRGACPKAVHFMEQVIYLPVGNLSEHDVSYLAQTLQHVVADSTNPQCASEVKNSSSNRTNRFWKKWRLNPLAFVLIVLDLFVLRGYLIVNFFLRAVPLVASWSLILVVVSIAFTHLLRWCIADFYLESSTAFAKYNSLLRDHTVTDVDNEVSSVEHDKKKSMLDTTVNDSILSKIKAIRLVKDNSKELHDSARALVTGATGFVGSLLLRDILRLRDSLGFSGGVVVLCRKKRGKSASDRIADLLRGDIFSFLSDNEKANLVVTVEGDVTKPKAGLSASDWDFVCRQANISHVFHCAASVSFTLTLLDAAKANITSALTMQALTARMNGRARFVHISTAFVHGGLAGSESSPLPEQLFSLEPFSPTKIYESMLGPLFYASKAMLELRFPNTYTFSKCVCEHLLTHATEVETVIIRPTIVGPAIENPREGWAGDKPQTIVAAASLYLSYQWNLWCFGAHDVPYIPVDVVTRLILAKGLNPLFRFEKDTPSDSETNSSEDDFERISRSSESSTLSEESHQFVHNTSWAAPECAEFKTTFIFNAAWSILSPSSFSWLQYAVAVTQLGSVLGYFAKSSTYLGLFFTAKVQPKLFMTQPKYERLHYILVQFPLQVATRLLAKVGLRSSRLETLAKYIDLPILFFPFMSRSFYFDSDILAPVELQGDRYLFLCAVAAERFLSNQLSKSTSGTASRTPRLRNVPNGVGLVIGGRAQQPRHSDFWTVLTEPRGNYYMRIAVWIFAKILRSTCDEVFRNCSWTHRASQLRTTFYSFHSLASLRGR
jgi:dTDP-4-amino-4,6-dideoxygalactose transaminase